MFYMGFWPINGFFFTWVFDQSKPAYYFFYIIISNIAMFIFLGQERPERTEWSPRTERTGKSAFYIMLAIVCSNLSWKTNTFASLWRWWRVWTQWWQWGKWCWALLRVQHHHQNFWSRTNHLVRFYTVVFTMADEDANLVPRVSHLNAWGEPQALRWETLGTRLTKMMFETLKDVPQTQKCGYIFENNCKLLFNDSWCSLRLDQVG